MSPFIEDFYNRKKQVRHYLAIVLSAERISSLGASTRTQTRRLLTLRGGTFLIIYNLIEASMRGAIDTIHDRIMTEQVPFELLTLGLRTEVVRRFKRDADPTIHHTMTDLPSAFVAVALDQGIKFSGNVDAKFIRELAFCYGFSCDTTNDKTWGGSDLVTIKTNRNTLAHGEQTFEEVGRDYPAQELLAISRRSLSFMNEILDNVETYLNHQGYRNKPLT